MAVTNMRAEETDSERMTRLETAAATERPHLATKADVERQTRLLIMWIVASLFAMFSFLILYMNDRLSAMDGQLKDILTVLIQSGS